MIRFARLTPGKIAFAHDVAMAGLSFWLSMWLRLGERLWTDWFGEHLVMAGALFTLVAAGVFLSQGLYRGMWRYASINDLMALTKATTFVILVFLPLQFLLTRLDALPRSTLIINWFALLALLGGPRFLYRLWKDQRIDLGSRAAGDRAVPVLLVGVGDAADLFIRASQHGSATYRAIGILSLKQSSVGRDIQGVPVLGTIDDLEQVVERLAAKGGAPERLILTQSEAGGSEVRKLFDRADAMGLSLARLPKLTDLKDGLTDKVEIKPVAVEDLLGRPQAVLDRAGMSSFIKGRRVVVTGAGGSIGGELVRQIADCGPASLVLVESCEFALYTIDMEASLRWPELDRVPVIADVRDRARIHQIMETHRPELVFHAAALKHVPMVEGNPMEGCLTNTLGTRIVTDACLAHGVRLMVLISTDKAVNPTNVMGATKRMAETYCQAMDSQAETGGTRFVTVRFGNVLGSTGSVVPLFQKQLATGGPITVTHPEMTRYFMTIREAVELVLQASTLGFRDAERYKGRIFVLDMGEPVKIVHLARQMIRLAGLRPDHDIKIAYTGLRPGEKLFEEIFHGAEAPVPTEMQGILVAAVRAGDAEVIGEALARLEAACRRQDQAAAMEILRGLVPEYSGEPGVAMLEVPAGR